MTVIRPNSISGVTSITAHGGDITYFKSDGTGGNQFTHNIQSTGVITATKFVGPIEGNVTGDITGSGANLTSIPAANITGTLPAISAANLTNVPAANITGTLPAIDGSALTGVGVGTADSINTSGIITATAFVSSQGALSNRNKIINGDFKIHQRGGTITAGGGNYNLDRWRTYRAGDSSGGFSVQQSLTSYPQTNIAGVIDNFKSSAFITVTSAGSAAANNNCKFQQRIEGSHVYDLAFGTAAAKKVTVSFYVKCSLTGDFGVALVNGAHNRSNVQLYTVNSASTWERKVITFDGDTSGSSTWNFGTGTGLQLMFDMGSGSEYHASSTGTWLSNEFHGTTSSVKLIHTNGATIQFAGVQLEAGSVATPFEHRSFGEELTSCYRYFQKDLSRRRHWASGNTSNRRFPVVYPVEMRDTPSVSFTSTSIDSGSLTANGITRQGYYTNMSGSGRFYE